MVIPSEQSVARAAPRQPSRYAEWTREKYMKALEAPQMVAAFHDSTLEIPSRLGSDGRSDTNNASVNLNQDSPEAEGATVRLHPPASPYTVMAGGVIPRASLPAAPPSSGHTELYTSMAGGDARPCSFYTPDPLLFRMPFP